MRILHWEEMFHPAFGYQINVLSKFQALQGHDVTIMAADKPEEHPIFRFFCIGGDIEEQDRIFSEKYKVKIIRLPIHTVISGRVIYKRGYIDKIIEQNPDVIMCHTNDTLSAMRIAQKHKKINKPIVFDNHMLEMASRNPLRNVFRWYFRTFITPIIIKNQWTVIRTQDDDYVNKCLRIPRELTPFISFGTDTSLFHPDEDERVKFRAKHGIQEDDFVVIYAGKLDEAKGGAFLAQALVEKFDTKRNVVFLIVGNTKGEYGEKVEESFRISQNRVIRFPTQRYTELAPFYQASDLAVFPKQCSLSFYDVQACGLPVVSEDNSVNVTRLLYNNGFGFHNNDVDDFREKMKVFIEMKESCFDVIRTNARAYISMNYDYGKICDEYSGVLEKEHERFHDDFL